MWILKVCISWNVKVWSVIRIPVCNPSLKFGSWITMGIFFTTVWIARNLWRPCLLLLEDCHAILLTGKMPITVQLQTSNLKVLLEVEAGRLRATWSGSCSGFPSDSICSYSNCVWPYLLCPWAHWSRDVLQNVWCSGTLTPAAASVLMKANVEGSDGAFFSPNTGAEGCCQAVLGLQQATKVTFLVLVNIIKHSEKIKKSVQSIRGCEWFVLHRLHILMSSSQQWGIPSWSEFWCHLSAGPLF